MIKTHVSPSGARPWRVLFLSGAVSALGALLAASPAVARPDGPLLPEGTMGLAAQQPAQSSAVDANGDAVMVWGATDGSGHYFEDAAVRPAGGEWEAPVALSPDAVTKEGTMPGETAVPPTESSVAFGPHGEAVAIWTIQTAEGQQLEASTLPSVSGHWTSAEPLSPTDEEAYKPSVAVGPEGAALAVWSIESEKIDAAEFRPGEGWEQLGMLSRSTAVEAANVPMVKFDSEGDALVVWAGVDLAGGHQRLTTDFRPAGEPFEGPEAPFGDTNSVGPKDFSFDEAGDAILVWENEPDDAEGVTEADLAERPAGSPWIRGMVQLSNEDARDPRVAVAPDGESVIVWQTANGLANIKAATFVARGPLSGVTPITDFTSGSEGATSPEVTIEPEGRSLVTWHAFSAGGEEVEEAAMGVGGNSWNTLGQLSPSPTEGPVLSGNASGESIASWVYDGEIETDVYDPASPRLASFSGPSEPHVGETVTFKVVPADMTRVEVEWEFGDGATAEGDEVTHTYTKAGEYPVRFTMTDQLGNGSYSGEELTVTEPTAETPSGETTTGSTTTTTTSTSTTPSTTTQSAPKTTPEWLALAKVERTKSAGDGALVLKAPGKGTITVSGAGVKTTTVKAKGKGAKTKIVLTPKGSFAKRLEGGHHRGYTEVTIVYTPSNGDAPIKATRRVRLVKR
jgi:plastocyanin